MSEFSPNTFYAATTPAAGVRIPVAGDLETEVCIVGAGFAGLWTARALLLRGHEVVLLDAGEVGGEATGRNGGFVSAGYAERVGKIAARVGVHHAREIYNLSRDGVELVRAFSEGNAGLDLKPGRLNVLRYNDEAGLEDQAEILARDFGHELEVWSRKRVRTALRSDRYYQALHEPDAFHLHPLNLARALASDIERRGGKIFENSAVVEADLDGLRKSVMTEKGRIRAFHVVLAGSAFLGQAFPRLARTVLPVRTHVAVTEPIGEILPKVIRYEGAIADTRRAGDYYRIVGDRLLWGGRITTSTKPPRNLDRIMARDIARVYPQLHGVAIEYAWSGTMGYAIHKMPQIGMVQPGVWIASAFGGHGLNTTAMAGEIIASAIVEQDDRWQLFVPFGLVWAGGSVGRAATQATYWSMRAKDFLDEALSKRTEQAEADVAEGLTPGIAARAARRAKQKFAQSPTGRAAVRYLSKATERTRKTKEKTAHVGRQIQLGLSAFGRVLVAAIWLLAGVIGFIARIVGRGMDLIAAVIGVALSVFKDVCIVAWRSAIVPAAKLIAAASVRLWERSQIGSSRLAVKLRAGARQAWKHGKLHAGRFLIYARKSAVSFGRWSAQNLVEARKWIAATAVMVWTSHVVPALKRLAEQANLHGASAKSGSIKLLQNARRSSASFGSWSAKQPAIIWHSWLVPAAKQAAERSKELKARVVEARQRSIEKNRPALENSQIELSKGTAPETKPPVPEPTREASKQEASTVELNAIAQTDARDSAEPKAKPVRKKRRPKEKSVEA